MKPGQWVPTRLKAEPLVGESRARAAERVQAELERVFPGWSFGVFFASYDQDGATIFDVEAQARGKTQ